MTRATAVRADASAPPAHVPLYEERIEAGDGVTLAASVAGERGRPGVILLHGAGQTRHSWRGSVATLGALGYHALAYDARGHGDSDWSPKPDYSYERLADDLDAIVRHMGCVPAMIGASMGGMTALHAIARTDEARARAVVLVDIAPRVDPRGLKRVHDFLHGHRDGFANVEEAADAVAAYNPHRPRPKNPRGLMKNLRLREDGRLHWHWDPRFFRERNDDARDRHAARLLTMCRGVTIPSMLVVGEESDVVNGKGIAELRAALPQLEIGHVAGAGHMIAGDRNEAFNGAILPFLECHPAR
ncbi:alpha/beta fold hydrolase [Caballeronia ptereochthonis]|uniref:Alpha/beta hydrolase fold protein n=1 Tax=Caballeronia ptereochthonis TaxID=1777144 RepID=A0A158CCG3_9BURK|nr:alpha/beta hydrolase [Caballeronia ptereochthonis]SAK80058.1 Alpha/beta hydrolase fold protein [Caballeronia ptereochthonis]